LQKRKVLNHSYLRNTIFLKIPYVHIDYTSIYTVFKTAIDNTEISGTIHNQGHIFHIYYDSQKVILSDSPLETRTITLNINADKIFLERVITTSGQTKPEKTYRSTIGGKITNRYSR